jgi:hypothetical protein
MTMQPSQNPSQLLQEAAAYLSLTDQQLQQLETLKAKHHLTTSPLTCQKGTYTASLVNGTFTKSGSYTVLWAHIHAEVKITAPQDGSIYAVEVKDGDQVVYSAQDIQVGQTLTFDYDPGFSIDGSITLQCTSDPQKTANLTIEGEGCLG